LLNFIVIDVKQVAKVKKTDKSATIVYVNRLDEFKPNVETANKYMDLLRRFGTNPNAVKFALQGSYYDATYRNHINRDSRAIKTLREIAVKAKTEPVYLVKENELPDINILVDMATIMVGAGVWK